MHHIPNIIADGVIKTSESNVSPHEYGVGPDVVWLFKKPIKNKLVPQMLTTTANVGGNQKSIPVDKSKIYIKVNLDPSEVQRADKFWKKNNVAEWWVKKMEGLGGASKSKDWYVIQRNIDISEWVEIGDRYNSTQIIDIGKKK